jgi:BirA family transcriptional regulator, biotin operon repressor / biotin---[acetyl-CoA-carboxylase] ligase
MEWPFVRQVVIHDVLESTNDRAKELLRQGTAELPLLVWTRCQTRGRGRADNRWWSDSGSLTFSVALNPVAHGLAVEHEPRMALAMAVAVIAALGDLALATPSIGIRWPNDLEAGGLKLGGILTEQLGTDEGRGLVVGAGLNVLTDLAAAPDQVRAMATSLAMVRGEVLHEALLSRLLAAILKRVESVIAALSRGEATLAAEWNRLDLLRNHWVRVDQGTSIIAGWGRGVDAEGALCLEVDARLIRLFGGRIIRD